MIGSDVLVQALGALGVRHLALNPGATLRGLHESLLIDGSPVQPITCLHEAVAVGMAHGYAKATGQIMAVGLHDTVGVLNATLAIFNAWADQAPMLLLGGVGPADTVARRPWIDWVHTTSDPGRPIHDLLVWSETPTSFDASLDAIRRAHQRARSTTQGPAFIGIDLAIQEAHIRGARTSRQPLEPWVASPSPASVARAAEAIRAARRPLIVSDRPLGLRAAECLVDVAERGEIPMVELDGAANVPVGHRLDLTPVRSSALAGADLLLLVDVRDPGLVVRTGRRTPRAIDVSAAPLRTATWMVSDSNAGDPLRLAGDVAAGLAALAGELAPTRRRRPWMAAEPARIPQRPASLGLDKAAIAHVTAEACTGRDVTVVHGAMGGHARTAFRFSRASQYLGRSGGEGLGYALPASIGAALGLRNSGRLAIGFETDGDALYTPQALWTAAKEGIPILLIVDNNRGYWRDELHQRAAARERGRDEERAASGVQIRGPDVSFVGLARSLGVAGEGPVTDPAQLRDAVVKGLRHVDDGHPFVIEVLTA